jgi:hypothetical protein
MKHYRKMKRGSKLILASWEGSVTRNDGVVTSARGEVTSGRENGVDDVIWAGANLTGPKNKENPHGRFSCYKWTIKI